jgi:hypothetical protein
LAELSSWLTRARSTGQSAPVAVALLLIANVIPLIGVMFLGWSVAMVLIAYWLENGIVGLINVPKIMFAGRETPGAAGQVDRVGVFVRALFFAVHYGIFWFVHGFFVFALTGAGPFFPFGVGSSVVDATAVGVIALALLISHGTSFVINYIGGQEYLRTTPERQSWQPYGRLVVLHITILLGGFVIMLLGQPLGLVVLLVALKTAADLALHLREHRRAAPVATVV